MSIALLLGGYQQSNYDGSISTTFGDSIGISGGSVNLNTAGESTSGYLRYKLSAVHVPEPGTMLMGGIAAAVGGAGAWWKQRLAAAEAAATPA